MRVAILIDSLRMGGAQKFVADFAVAAARRIEPCLICLREGPSPSLRKSMEAAGVRLEEFPAGHLIDLPRFRRLLDLLASQKFDVIHTHLAYANILGSIAGRLTNTPVVATLHTSGSAHDQESARARALERFCLRHLTGRIVAVGYQVAESFRDSFDPRKVRIIQNGIPEPDPISAQARQSARAELAGSSQGPIVISVARLAAVKGHADLVDAFALLHTTVPDATLAMVGGGRLFEPIRDRVESRGLRDSVRMLGHRDHVAALLAASDVFASASHREGLPLAVLEGMMAGLPVVATNVGDLPRLVTEETGRLVPPHRPDLLAEALREVLVAPQARQAMGQAARERTVREYSIELCVDRHIALYREVIDARGGGGPTWQPSA